VVVVVMVWWCIYMSMLNTQRSIKHFKYLKNRCWIQSRVVLRSQHKCSGVIYTSPSFSISASSLKFGTIDVECRSLKWFFKTSTQV
jgi:hypothetical protein